MNRDITISELPATTVADDNSYIPIDNGDITYRIKVSDYNAGANVTAKAYAEAAGTHASAAAESASSAAEASDLCMRRVEMTESSVRTASDKANEAQTYANTAYEYAAAASTSASNATSQAQQVSDYAREAGEKSEDAEAFAVGQRKGVDVTSEDETFENNAKYYKEQASAEVARISDLTANVSSNALKAEGYAVGTQNGSPILSEYSQNNAKYYAENAAASANDARFSKNTAIQYANKAENAVVKIPYIGDNNHWYVYNFDQEKYIDTNVGATGAPGQQGDPGTNGITPTITATASVDNTSGTPSVTVQKSGSNTNPSFAFSFSGLKGQPGGASYDDTEIKSEINDIWKAQGELGAKNLLKYPYYGTTRSYEGIEFVDNKGIITINGISTVSANYYLRYNEPIYLKKGTYVLSVATPLGNNARIQVVYKNGSGEQILASITRNTVSKEFTITDDIISNAEYWYIRIVILANAQIDNLVVAPMICPPGITDNVWQPYTLTNRELTERVKYLNTRNKLTVGNGTGYDYTSLTDAIIAASEATNIDIYVSDGTYDIYSEFIEKYGANYFKANNFTSQPNYEGLPLNNGVNLYFASGAKVVCELPTATTSETAQNSFSAFKLNGTDAGLYNLDLYCKNTRYSIHDEASGQGSYHHVYKDCRIEQARDQNSFGYETCIGGGCGLHGRIDIDNCYFKGATANGYSLTWHNGSQSGAQNYIFISNSYFEQGKIRFRYYGVSDLISRMTISGCSMPFDIDEPTPETSSSTIVNTEIVKWNNIIKSSHIYEEYLPTTANGTVKKYSAAIGATTATFNASVFMSKYGLTSSDLNLDISAETTSGNVLAYNSVAINSSGVITITFDELTEAATFVCKASKIQ